MSADEQILDIALGDVRQGAVRDGCQPLWIATDRGDLALRYHRAAGAVHGALLLGEAETGFPSPADELYARLCAALVGAGVSALRLSWRRPGDLAESALDALIGLHFLRSQGIDRLGVVGHGFGAAAAAQAAANADGVRALVALAAQSEGLGAVAALPAGCACLFVHGTDDAQQPLAGARRGYAAAREPKYLRVFSGAGHALAEVAGQLERELTDWLLLELTEGDPRLRR